jgi:hypothetical protein
LFYCLSLKMHDYVASWFEGYLRNLLSSLYNYCCISAIERKRGQMFKNIDKKTLPIVNKENHCWNSYYFFAGGRHQIAVNGKIVYEYLQTCTKIKLLDNHEYFKQKQFNFKSYTLLSAVSINISEPIVLFFYSKIPLDQLAIYLNKELRDISVLHRIFIPAKADKKKNIDISLRSLLYPV